MYIIYVSVYKYTTTQDHTKTQHKPLHINTLENSFRKDTTGKKQPLHKKRRLTTHNHHTPNTRHSLSQHTTTTFKTFTPHTHHTHSQNTTTVHKTHATHSHHTLTPHKHTRAPGTYSARSESFFSRVPAFVAPPCAFPLQTPHSHSPPSRARYPLTVPRHPCPLLMAVPIPPPRYSFHYRRVRVLSEAKHIYFTTIQAL